MERSYQIGLLSLLLLIGCGGPVQDKADYTLDIKEFLREFASKPITSKTKYLGKRIQLNGIVESTKSVSFTDTHHLKFQGVDIANLKNFELKLQFIDPKSQKDVVKLKKLEKGEPATVTCMLVDVKIAPMLKKCRFVL